MPKLYLVAFEDPTLLRTLEDALPGLRVIAIDDPTRAAEPAELIEGDAPAAEEIPPAGPVTARGRLGVSRPKKSLSAAGR